MARRTTDDADTSIAEDLRAVEDTAPPSGATASGRALEGDGDGDGDGAAGDALAAGMTEPGRAVRVRPLEPDDVDRLQTIEDAADRALVALLRPDSWDGAPAGAERVAEPGFVLVADEDGAVVGFVHVIETEGLAHLEQVAVLPEHGLRGHGRALVEAAKREAARRGYARLTLRTYAGIPFNAPFYASCGFLESEPDTPFLRGLIEVEAGHGLERWGRRVQMTVPLGPAPR